ncbi:MAG: hypothetical protein ACFFC3_01270 [Candidatus Odinarchaeota archaeon]
MVDIINKSIFFEEEFEKSCRIKIACPVCKKCGQVDVPKNILKKEGITTISIPSKSLCEHNFQVFLDPHYAVRGYQSVDFEIEASSSNSTEFTCLMCGADVRFNINDKNSYLKKQKNEKFFGKETCSYEVAHYSKDELHVNNVLVDNNGHFQDYLNTYKVKLENFKNTDQKSQKFYKLSNNGQKPLESHPIFNIFLIFNTFNNWVFELVSPSHINIMELILLLDTKMQETRKVYSTLPEYLNVSIAEQNFHIWNSGDNFICINLNEKDSEISWIRKVISNMNNQINSDAQLISKSPRILLISDFLNHSNIDEKKEALIDRLIFDDLLYSKIEIKYKDRIPRIIERVSPMFSINQEYLVSYFNTNLNTIEFLRSTGNIGSFEKLLKVIDFVNRRNLLM